MENEWEEICSYTQRLRVYGGWIVRTYDVSGANEVALAMCFVPDKEYRWEDF
jgi:hypothetical protein